MVGGCSLRDKQKVGQLVVPLNGEMIQNPLHRQDPALARTLAESRRQKTPSRLNDSYYFKYDTGRSALDCSSASTLAVPCVVDIKEHRVRTVEEEIDQ